MIPMQQLVNEQIKENYQDREHPHWHVSALGGVDPCAQYLERIGEEPDEGFDDRTLRVFSVGHIMEAWILDLLEPKVDSMDRQTDLVDEKLDIAGHPDAIVEYQGVKKIYEIKTIHSWGFTHLKKEGKSGYDHHRMQLWMYLYMTGIEEGSLVYLSKDDLRIAEYPVYLSDDKLKKECMDLIDYLNVCWEKKKPPKPITDVTDFRYKYNKYKKKCEQILKEGEYYE